MERDELERRLLESFVEEFADGLIRAEDEALAWEREPSEADDRVRELLRIAHALKGAARAVSEREIEAVLHALESRLAERDASFDPGALLSVLDVLRTACEALRGGKEPDREALLATAARLGGTSAQGQSEANAASRQPRQQPEATSKPEPQAAVAHAPLAAGMRVAAGDLDRLLSRSGQLLTVRGRVEERTDSLGALRPALQAHGRRLAKLEKRARAEPQLRTKIGELEEEFRRLDATTDQLLLRLAIDVHELRTLSHALEEGLRDLRMVPFGVATAGLDRMVRDLAKSSGKKARLQLDEEGVRLDRAVAEALREPLIHLVRNAIDHGIESPAERREAGKPEEGRVVIRARISGEQVRVRVEDDGRGLDVQAIWSTAVRKGMRPPEGRDEAERLIFEPSFSTRPRAGTIPGRGLGLDLVRGSVELLRGGLALDWDPGRGTAVTLFLPVSLATGRKLVVRVGAGRFAFPSDFVRRVVRVGAQSIASIEGREVLITGGAPVPLFSLANLLGLQTAEPARAGLQLPAVVLGEDREEAAIVVEVVERVEEAVVKPLGPRLQGIEILQGAALLPGGETAMILRPRSLLERVLEGRGTSNLAEAMKKPEPARRPRILLVDDSLTTRSLERSILESAGYEVVVAADGEEALAALREQQVDLVISDVEMPRMDGFELTERLRRSRRMARLPVILVTGRESEVDKNRGLRAGANAYLTKSTFDQRGLLDTIARLL